MSYRGRLAPSPTGYLHLGHARTFWIAQQRARTNSGALVLRIEDLDSSRIRPEFTSAIYEDLRWLGLDWQEGPDVGGGHAPYSQSERLDIYRDGFALLKTAGSVYPCTCSRQDVLRAITAPHEGDDEPIYPGTCRPSRDSDPQTWEKKAVATGKRINWRFRVPDGQHVEFNDFSMGRQSYEAGNSFGDFVVWRHDDLPAYQLAVTLDDATMKITEVVRGADLLISTARQLLLYAAFGLKAPAFYHCPLITDEHGVRLAKRNDALSLRHLRSQGARPEDLCRSWGTIGV